MPRKNKKTKKSRSTRRNARWKKIQKAALPLGYWLLDLLSTAIELLPDPLEGPRGHMRRLSGWPREVSCKRIYYELNRMKDRGWIEEAEKQGKKFFKLTKKGRLRAWYRKIEGLAPPSKTQWDRKWTTAFFDIPEHTGRAERDAIRRTLIAAGFYCLQKSVYIYPGKIPDDIIDYFTEAELLPFIRFARIDRIDDDADLKKHFGF